MSIFTSFTPSIALTAFRAWITTVPGSWRVRSTVKETKPAAWSTFRSLTIPVLRMSLPSRGLWTLERAAATRAVRSDCVISDGLHGADFGDGFTEPDLDPLLQGDGARGTAVAGAPHAEGQGPVGVIVVDDLDASLVGGDIGPQAVEGLFDAGQRIHMGLK